MMWSSGGARRLVAAFVSASLVAGVVAAPGLAQAAEDLSVVRDDGVLEVVEDGSPGDVGALGAAAEDPVVATARLRTRA